MCLNPKEKFVYKDSDYELFTFLGTNNDVRNVIEVKPRYVFTKTRITTIRRITLLVFLA